MRAGMRAGMTPAVRFARAAALMSVFALLATSSDARAQDARSHTAGFTLGAHLNGSAITVDDSDIEAGGGLGVHMGYGVSDAVLLFAELDLALVRPGNEPDYSLGHFDVGARIHFLDSTAGWRPYLLGSVTGFAAAWDDVWISGQSYDVVTSGRGISIGGGAMFYFSAALALDMNLRWTPGSMKEIEVDGVSADIDMDATTSRFNLGLTWFPSGRQTVALSQ